MARLVKPMVSPVWCAHRCDAERRGSCPKVRVRVRVQVRVRVRVSSSSM